MVYQTTLRIKQANLMINVLSINTVAKLCFRIDLTKKLIERKTIRLVLLYRIISYHIVSYHIISIQETNNVYWIRLITRGFRSARKSRVRRTPPAGRVAAITYDSTTASSPATSQLPYPKLSKKHYINISFVDIINGQK